MRSFITGLILLLAVKIPADNLHWQQQAELVDGGSLIMHLRVSDTLDEKKNAQGALALYGTPEQALIICAGVENSQNITPIASLENKYHFLQMENRQAWLNYTTAETCPASLSGKYRYDFVVSDKPLILVQKSGYAKTVRRDKKAPPAISIPGAFTPGGLLIVPGGGSFGGFFPGDNTDRKRPGFQQQSQNFIELIYSMHLRAGAGQPRRPGLYYLSLDVQGQDTVYIPVQEDMLHQLIANMHSIPAVMAWLQLQRSGREDFINHLLDRLQALTLVEDEIHADSESLEQTLLEQLQVLLEYPDQHFSLSFEWGQMANHLAAFDTTGLQTGIIPNIRLMSCFTAEEPLDGEHSGSKRIKVADSSSEDSDSGGSSSDGISDSEMETEPSQGDEETGQQEGGDQPPPWQPAQEAEEVATRLGRDIFRSREACYAKDSTEIQNILSQLQQENPQAFVVLISHPSDLYEDDLLSRVHVRPSGETVLAGRVYSGEAVVLVIDATHIPAGQLAEFNELYDNPPTLHGQPLGTGVKVVTLVSQRMKALPDQSTESKPAVDFWGRISHPLNRLHLAQQYQPGCPKEGLCIDDPHLGILSLDSQDAPMPEDDQTVVLDFSNPGDWRTTLFGVPAIDETGAIKYQDSLLVNAAGKPIILLGAPWTDMNFRLRLWQILQSGQFEANGQVHSLQGSYFYARSQPASALEELKQAVSCTRQLPGSRIFINRFNLDNWLSGAEFTNSGTIIAHDALQTAIANGFGIQVTSKLGFQQWLQLLHKLKNYVDSGSGRIWLSINHPEIQPEAFQKWEVTEEIASDETVSSQVQVVSCRDEQCTVQQLGQDKAYLELNITPGTRLSSLTSRIDILSSRNRLFSVTEFELLAALRSGRPVLIRSLELNPELQAHLESLLNNPAPGLLVNGHYQSFKNADITLLVPDEARMDSVVWQAATGQATEQEAEDITPPSASEIADLRSSGQLAAINQLLEAIRSLGISARKEWPAPPALTRGLIDKLYVQLELEKQITNSPEVQQEHWRRAVTLVILEEYRGNTEVYAWLKFVRDRLFPEGIQDQLWIDARSLQQFAESAYFPDRTWLRKHFWQLARSIGPGWLQDWPTEYQEPSATMLDLVSSCLISMTSVATEQLRLQMANPVEHFSGNGSPRNRQREKALRKHLQALRASHGIWLPEDSAIIQTAAQMDEAGEHALEWQQAIQQLLLAGGNGDASLPDEVYPKQEPWVQWNSLRRQQLVLAVQHYPIVFLKGEAGSGKSYMAGQVARQMNPGQTPVIFTASPEMDEDALFATQELAIKPIRVNPQQLSLDGFDNNEVQHIVNAASASGELTLTPDVQAELRSRLGRKFGLLQILYKDQYTRWHNAPLQQWLDMPATAKAPVFLIIDEANLLQPGTLNVLKALFSTTRTVLHGGREAGKLSPYHRLIITGNPESAGGRALDKFIREHGLTLYYPPMTDEFMMSGIMEPRVSALSISDEQKARIMDLTGVLWQQYRKLLPGHEFTPRDMHDIADRMEISLVNYDLNIHTEESGEDALAGLVWHGFLNSLGGEISPESTRKMQALQYWYQAHYGLQDTTIQATRKLFEAYYQQLSDNSGNNDFFFAGESVRQLAWLLWQQLDRTIRDRHYNRFHLGKHATLIEGPAGRGKDQLLQRMLKPFTSGSSPALPEPLLVSGGTSSWIYVKEKILQARREGRIIIIPEINLLPTQYLEGELNDVLAGGAAPGFHLFATVNPTSFSGRKPLSAALASRFSIYRISDYNSQELEAIVTLFMPDHPAQARTLTLWHLQLRQQLMQARQKLLPGNRELRAMARFSGNININKPLLHTLFRAHYRLYTDHVPALQPPGSGNGVTGNDRVIQPEQMDMPGLYRALPDLPPVTVKMSSSSSYDPEAGILELNRQLTSTAALMNEVEMLLIRHQWESKGLPLMAPDAYDSLLSALYHYWQQQFAIRLSRNTEPHQIFPMQEVEKKTLAIRQNQRLVRDVKKLLEDYDYTPEPAVYLKLRKLLKTSRSLSDTEKAEQERQVIEIPLVQPCSVVTAEPVKQPVQKKVTSSPHDKTIPKIYLDHDHTQQRIRIIRPEIDDDGRLYLVEGEFGLEGFNWLTPDPFDESRVLSPSEVQGHYQVEAIPGDWVIIPGLKEFPHAMLRTLSGYIDGAIIHGTIEAVHDRYSGLNLFRWLPPDHIAPTPGYVPIEIRFTMEKVHPSGTKETMLVRHQPVDPSQLLVASLNRDEAAGPRLREIQTAPSLKDKVTATRDFVMSFRAAPELEKKQGSDHTRLIEIISKGPGPSYYRTLAFWSLLSTLGIPSRIAGNQSSHHWGEYSLDGGYTWIPVDLGGDEPRGGTLREDKGAFPALSREQVPDPLDISFHPEKIEPERAVRILSSMGPDSKWFGDLYEALPELLHHHLPRGNALTLDIVKEKLQEYHRKGALTHNLMKAILEKLNTPTTREYHDALWKFMVLDNKWLSSDLHAKGISYLSDSPDDLVSGHPAQSSYYLETLTTRLERGRDIIIELPGEDEDDDKFPDEADIMDKYMPPEMLPGLASLLYGELPRADYRPVPPGSINIPRLVRQQPAFRQTAAKPALRPTMIISPLRVYHRYIEYVIEQKIAPFVNKTPRHTPRFDRYSEPRSQLLTDFMVHITNRAFLRYLYQFSGGAEGNLKLLYPSGPMPFLTVKLNMDSDRSRQHIESWNRVDKRKNTPLKPGYLIPRSLEEFMTASRAGRNYYDSALLSRAWLSKGFSEPALSVLNQLQIDQLMVEFVEHIDFPGLMRELLPSDCFLQYQAKEEERIRSRYKYDYLQFTGQEELGDPKKDNDKKMVHPAHYQAVYDDINLVQ